jgi:hypothetical protein
MRYTQLMVSIRASLIVQQTPSQPYTGEHAAPTADNNSNWSNTGEENDNSIDTNGKADTDVDETLKKDGGA